MRKCKICQKELNEEEITIDVVIDYPYNLELKCCENCVDELITYIDDLISNN